LELQLTDQWLQEYSTWSFAVAGIPIDSRSDVPSLIQKEEGTSPLADPLLSHLQVVLWNFITSDIEGKLLGSMLQAREGPASEFADRLLLMFSGKFQLLLAENVIQAKTCEFNCRASQT
jgi:hypothetical protein